MHRHTILPRENWEQRVEKTGLTFHSLKGRSYWDESAYWEFSAAEIDLIEAATAELQQMCLAAGDYILAKDRFAQMGIPDEATPWIRETWQGEPPALYGRMDLAFDGHNLKLLEYNADTPTSLVEAAVTQWYWLEDRFPNADQFNSLHEKLVAKWSDLVPYLARPIYFAHEPSEEDRITITYLRDTAEQAGLKTASIRMNDIGWRASDSTFVDLEMQTLRSVFKLYPWEWMLGDRFAAHLLATMKSVTWIEPIWKMLWSNKTLLAILWEMFPGHELLLPAFVGETNGLDSYVRKPVLGREGANVTVVQHGITMEATVGEYTTGPFVFQQFVDLASSGSIRAVVGSWLIDGEPAGMGIRESDGLVTTNTSRFVPHLFQ